MLSAKPWKAEAIMRLVLSVILCVLVGALSNTALRGLKTGSSRVAFLLCITVGLGCLLTSLLLLHRPWRTVQPLRRLMILLACFYGGVVLGMIAEKMAIQRDPTVGQMIIAAVSLQGAALVFMATFVREHNITWHEAFGFSERPARAILLGSIGASVFLPLAHMLQLFSAELLTRLHFRPELQQVVQTLKMSHSTTGRLVFGIFTILVVPPAEEMLFRGILYPWLKRLGFRTLALWSTSLLFGAVHTNLPSFVPLTVLGLGLIFLYEQTGNLLAPITAHAIFNGFNFVQFWRIQG